MGAAPSGVDSEEALAVADLLGVTAVAAQLSFGVFSEDIDLRLVDLTDLELVGVPVLFCTSFVIISDCKGGCLSAAMAEGLVLLGGGPEMVSNSKLTSSSGCASAH